MRRDDREVRGRAGVQCILEIVKVLHLRLMDRDYPYIASLHYGYVYTGDVFHLYMYGAKEGKELVLAMSNPRAFIKLDYEVEMTGEGDIARVYGVDYMNLIARGEVTVVKNPEEKIGGLELLMQMQIGRDFGTTAQQAADVVVFRFDVESYSTKERKKKQRQLRQQQTTRRQHIKKAV